MNFSSRLPLHFICHISSFRFYYTLLSGSKWHISSPGLPACWSFLQILNLSVSIVTWSNSLFWKNLLLYIAHPTSPTSLENSVSYTHVVPECLEPLSLFPFIRVLKENRLEINFFLISLPFFFTIRENVWLVRKL